MAVMQVITASTLNRSPDRTGAVGKNTKWSGKLPDALRALPKRTFAKFEAS